MRGLRLALGHTEAGGDERLAVDQARVGGERHVGEAGHGLDELERRAGGERLLERFPLPPRQLPVGAADVAFHPGVDDVVDAVEPRPAQQEPLLGAHGMLDYGSRPPPSSSSDRVGRALGPR